MKISEVGYLEIDNELLNKYEKEEKLGIKQDILIESQYIYFNSTNKGDLLIYNKLNNCLLRINNDEIFEYYLPKLYESEFSKKPEFMIMYILDNKENHDIENTYLAYILEDLDPNNKILVFRKINIKNNQYDISQNQYTWIEIDFIENKIFLDNEILRGIIWWDNYSSKNYPSILLITNLKLKLFNIQEKQIQLIWEIIENNIQIWFNMEFQCILLQTESNIITPYINIGNDDKQRPVKLPHLELLLNTKIKYQDILLLVIYQNLYCIHIDHSHKKVSLRNLFDQITPDLVLDIENYFEDFTLLLINNIIVIMNIHDKKQFSLFDIKLLHREKNNNIYRSTSYSNIKDNLITSTTNSQDSNNYNYYLVPSLFNDQFKYNTIICLYNNNNLEEYKMFAKKINNNLNDYNIILINSSINIIIKINFNKIQYSKLKFCINKLIDDIIISKEINDINIEKIDIIPFILNRNNLWDNILLIKLKELVKLEKERNNNLINFDKEIINRLPKILTLILEILKIKLESKIKIDNDYYWILLDLLFYYKQESLLQYILQYHIMEDSDLILRELYNLYIYNDLETKINILKDVNLKYFKLNNKLWLEQICLDMSYRLNNINILIDILIRRKEYRRAINILRKYSNQEILLNINDNMISLELIISRLSKNIKVCKYPIYNILYKVGIDIDEQKNDPYLFKDLIKEIKCWINDYFNQIDIINEKIREYNIKKINMNNFNNNKDLDSNKILISIIGRPNINKCDIWLPELINMKDLNNNNILDNNNNSNDNIDDDDDDDDDDDYNNNNNNMHVNNNNNLNIKNMHVDNGINKIKKNHPTMESVYMSATESEENFILVNKDDKINNEKLELFNNDEFTSRNSKSPLLYIEPNLITSNLQNNELSDISSSISSTSSSSFNSYE